MNFHANSCQNVLLNSPRPHPPPTMNILWGQTNHPTSWSAALDHFEETETWIRPRRLLDHPDNCLSQTAFLKKFCSSCCLKQQTSEAKLGRREVWKTMKLQKHVRLSWRANRDVVSKESIVSFLTQASWGQPCVLSCCSWTLKFSKNQNFFLLLTWLIWSPGIQNTQ